MVGIFGKLTPYPVRVNVFLHRGHLGRVIRQNSLQNVIEFEFILPILIKKIQCRSYVCQNVKICGQHHSVTRVWDGSRISSLSTPRPARLNNTWEEIRFYPRVTQLNLSRREQKKRQGGGFARSGGVQDAGGGRIATDSNTSHMCDTVHTTLAPHPHPPAMRSARTRCARRYGCPQLFKEGKTSCVRAGGVLGVRPYPSGGTQPPFISPTLHTAASATGVNPIPGGSPSVSRRWYTLEGSEPERGDV